MKTAAAPSVRQIPTSRPTRGPGPGRLVAVALLLGVALLAGHFLAELSAPALHSRMLPWILSRGLGLAALLSLAALTGLGLWLHHPWRASISGVRPISWLRAHSALAATTVMLVVAHLTAIALDRYAHVGWLGALVPWRSAYRPSPVALGTLALWMIILVGASAGLAGVIGGGRWLAIHRMAWLSFAAAWLHGVTAGSDTARLRLIYLATGIAVTSVAATRAWALRHRADERVA
jgi:hypothetical protein